MWKPAKIWKNICFNRKPNRKNCWSSPPFSGVKWVIVFPIFLRYNESVLFYQIHKRTYRKESGCGKMRRYKDSLYNYSIAAVIRIDSRIIPPVSSVHDVILPYQRAQCVHSADTLCPFLFQQNLHAHKGVLRKKQWFPMPLWRRMKTRQKPIGATRKAWFNNQPVRTPHERLLLLPSRTDNSNLLLRNTLLFVSDGLPGDCISEK